MISKINLFAAALPLPFLLYIISSIYPLSSSLWIQCTILSSSLGDRVSFPSTADYNATAHSYFSAFGNELSPSCVVTPQTVSEVSKTVRILSLTSKIIQCRLAVRGGGHTTFATSANIDGGITLDMRLIANIEVNEHRNITTIGSGALWGNVSTTLDPMGLALPGGRVSKTGVAGLALGGGISYFSTRKGFVCDNIVNYEIVLASGKVVNANKAEHPDLWRALKGGSNNFGIVTRFDVETFEQGPLWGGSVFYAPTAFPQLIKETYLLATAPNYDEYAHIITSYGAGQGAFVAASNLYYTQATVNPASLQPFTSIEPQLFSSLRISNLTDFTEEQAAFSTDGLRQTFFTTTIKPDISLMHTVWSLWNQTQASIGNAENLGYSFCFQPLPQIMTTRSRSRRGNALAIDQNEGPLLIILLTAYWTNPNDDQRIIDVQRQLIIDIDAAATSSGSSSQFKYLNYAYAHQKPLAAKGTEERELLEMVSRKYDPMGFFQTGVPGGFKIFE